MVYKCFVYGCKTHTSGKRTTFGVPKDPDLLRQWERALRPHSNGKILKSIHRVCKAHFRAEEIELYYNHVIQGTEVKIERGRPELKPGAVPSVFAGHKKPRRVLSYKKDHEPEVKGQSILLLNGEWVHVKTPEKPAPPVKKCVNRIRTSKTSTYAVKSKKTNPRAIEKVNLSENLNADTGAQLLALTEEIFNDTASNDAEAENDHKVIELQELPKVKVPEKEISSICINWDALPLPEEIGSLFCDGPVPHINSSSDFYVQSSKSNSPQVPSPLTPPAPEGLLTEYKTEENTFFTNIVTEDRSEEEENFTLTFQSLCLRMSEIQMPTPMWGMHTDHTRVYFSCMSHTSFITAPTAEKIVMYQSGMKPHIFLRGIEVSIPETERKSKSLEAVEMTLAYVDKLKLCVGIDSTGGIASYSSDCDLLVESGRSQRCQTCKEERSVEYSKKRHLETDVFLFSPSRLLKKKSPRTK